MGQLPKGRSGFEEHRRAKAEQRRQQAPPQTRAERSRSQARRKAEVEARARAESASSRGRTRVPHAEALERIPFDAKHQVDPRKAARKGRKTAEHVAGGGDGKRQRRYKHEHAKLEARRRAERQERQAARQRRQRQRKAPKTQRRQQVQGYGPANHNPMAVELYVPGTPKEQWEGMGRPGRPNEGTPVWDRNANPRTSAKTNQQRVRDLIYPDGKKPIPMGPGKVPVTAKAKQFFRQNKAHRGKAAIAAGILLGGAAVVNNSGRATDRVKGRPTGIFGS